MWYTGLLTVPEEYIVKLADMELIMMVQWLIFKQTTMLCQNHTFSLQITNCRSYTVEWTLFLMTAILELATFWTLWQSFKVSMSSNEKDLSPTKVFWHFLWCKWEKLITVIPHMGCIRIRNNLLQRLFLLKTRHQQDQPVNMIVTSFKLSLVWLDSKQ